MSSFSTAHTAHATAAQAKFTVFYVIIGNEMWGKIFKENWKPLCHTCQQQVLRIVIRTKKKKSWPYYHIWSAVNIASYDSGQDVKEASSMVCIFQISVKGWYLLIILQAEKVYIKTINVCT